MDKARVETWVWVLIYGGLFLVVVSVFMLRAGAESETSALAWLMLAVGALATAAGAALVVLRARMDEPLPPKKGRRE